MIQRGIRKTNPLPIITLVAATPLTLYQLTPNRSGILRKIHLHNLCAADTLVDIGTGLAAAFAAFLPPIYTVNGMDLVYGENETLAVEFWGDITFQSAIAGVTATVEVEEVE